MSNEPTKNQSTKDENMIDTIYETNSILDSIKNQSIRILDILKGSEPSEDSACSKEECLMDVIKNQNRSARKINNVLADILVTLGIK